MTPTEARRIALEVWFPRIPAEKARAQPPPSDDRTPVELSLPDTPADKAQPPKQTRVRKPTLTHALKEADRAGRQVKVAAIYADRVEITFGQPEPAGTAPANATAAADGDLNEWEREFGPLPPEVRQ